MLLTFLLIIKAVASFLCSKITKKKWIKQIFEQENAKKMFSQALWKLKYEPTNAYILANLIVMTNL